MRAAAGFEAAEFIAMRAAAGFAPAVGCVARPYGTRRNVAAGLPSNELLG